MTTLKRIAPGPEIAGATKLRLLQVYPKPVPRQAPSWWIETERLAAEFRRTQQLRHLQALARHLDGVFDWLTTGG
jgi:hypothetical protein